MTASRTGPLVRSVVRPFVLACAVLAGAVVPAAGAEPAQYWTLSDGAPDDSLQSVAHGGGRFAAVAFGGGAMTSPDGITWTMRSSPDNEWFGVTHGQGLFVAVARGGSGASGSARCAHRRRR